MLIVHLALWWLAWPLRAAYLAAATGKIDVAVAYYGGGIQSCLDVADKVAQPILFHFAENDHAIPLLDVDDVKTALAHDRTLTFLAIHL